MTLDGLLKELHSDQTVAGTILGSFLGFVFILLGFLRNKILDQIPGNKVLKEFRRVNTINVFVKYLYNDNENYWMPLALDSQHSKTKMEVTNTYYVIGEADFKAIADVIIPLGKYAKAKATEYLSPHLNIEQWNNPYICIGTSQKTIKILDEKRCEPLFFENKIIESESKRSIGFIFKHEHYKGFYHDNEEEKTGHGIIQKTRDKKTNVGVFMIMGHGKLGTQTAAHFFKENIKYIGRIYGSKYFVLLIKAESNIPETGKVITLYPQPSLFKKILFLRSWKKLTSTK